MKVLITGSTGFVGSSLLEFVKDNLNKDQIEIVLLSSSKSNKVYRTILYTKENGHYSFPVNEYFDVVLHLGAWTPKSGKDINDVNKSFSNIDFTNALLNELQGKVSRIVFVSTLDVYAEENTIVDETSKVSPVSLYGYSKLFCEQMVSNWCLQNGVSSCILRLGHIYGEGEGAYKKMIPVFINNALNRTVITIFSRGKELRNFFYIKDCVSCIWQTISKNDITGIINLVSGKSYSVKDIATFIKELIDPALKIEIQGKDMPVRNLIFDNTKLLANFILEETNIRDGLMTEINYFKNQL